jgi:hypothetical protein
VDRALIEVLVEPPRKVVGGRVAERLPDAWGQRGGRGAGGWCGPTTMNRGQRRESYPAPHSTLPCGT